MIERTPLTHKELHQLSDLWLGYWEASPEQFQGGNAEMWFNAVMDFLEQSGAEVFTRELREREFKMMADGKAQEYAAALKDVVEATHARSEYELAILVLTASPDEREVALAKVGA